MIRCHAVFLKLAVLGGLLFAVPAYTQPVPILTLRGGPQFGYPTVAGGDFNQDGVRDILVGAGFAPPRLDIFSGANGALLYSVSALASPSTFGRLTVPSGDTNQDGTPDFLVADWPQDSVYLFSGRNGALLHTFQQASGGTFGQQVLVGDIDGNGGEEVLISSGYGATSAFRIYDLVTRQLRCQVLGSASGPVAQNMMLIKVAATPGLWISDRVAINPYFEVYRLSGSQCTNVGRVPAPVDAYTLSFKNLSDLDRDGTDDLGFVSVEPATAINGLWINRAKTFSLLRNQSLLEWSDAEWNTSPYSGIGIGNFLAAPITGGPGKDLLQTHFIWTATAAWDQVRLYDQGSGALIWETPVTVVGQGGFSVDHADLTNDRRDEIIVGNWWQNRVDVYQVPSTPNPCPQPGEAMPAYKKLGSQGQRLDLQVCGGLATGYATQITVVTPQPNQPFYLGTSLAPFKANILNGTFVPGFSAGLTLVSDSQRRFTLTLPGGFSLPLAMYLQAATLVSPTDLVLSEAYELLWQR